MAPKIAGRWRTNRAFRWYGSTVWNALLYRIFYPLRSPAGKGRHPFLISLDYDDTLMAAAGTQAEESLKTSSRNTMANISSQ